MSLRRDPGPARAADLPFPSRPPRTLLIALAAVLAAGCAAVEFARPGTGVTEALEAGIFVYWAIKV